MGLKVSEHEMQAAYFDWVRMMENQDERFKNIFAIPNGGLRNIRVAQKLKREGVRPGIFDVAIMVTRTIQGILCHGAFLEFKVDKNKLTKEQIGFMNRMIGQGYDCGVCYSLDEAIDFTEVYLGIK